MKKRGLASSLAALIGFAAFAQCSIGFSHADNGDTLAFTNGSTVPNAHYYWNFGDGSTSYSETPVHAFPASGRYLVTLYGRDTLGTCHAYHDEWIDVVQASSDPCQPVLIDTLLTYNGDDYISADAASIDCDGYEANIDAGPAQNDSPGNWIWLGGGWGDALWVDRIQYSTADSINGYSLRKEYYNTLPYHYDRNVNYGDCSANFEFHADYQPDGALVTFRAMDPAGVDTFYVIGFGNPIIFASSSGSHLYPYVSYDHYFPWMIYHQNTQGGCTTQCTQTLMIENPNYVTPPSCAILTQPTGQGVLVGNNAQFIIGTVPGTAKQWQQDAGLGWQDLTDAGPFSGVNTDTLTVADCQGWWNNYQYRCVVTVAASYCHNTSGAAALNVSVGIDELAMAGIRLYPNPVADVLQLQWDQAQGPVQVSIMNALGQEVMNGHFTGTSANLDITTLDPGVYLLSILAGERRIQGRFVKQ